MTRALLDTNIVSFFLRNDTRAKTYLSFVSRPGIQLAVSFQTVGELFEGAYRARWGEARVTHLEGALLSYVILESTPDTARLWGAVRAERRTRPISPDDAWIAATARAHECVLVTHNPADFEDISGLTVLTVDGQGQERWIRS